MYEKLKKHHGETFARTIRDRHSGILEIPEIDVILQHAGCDATPLLPYLTGLLHADSDAKPLVATQQDPFALLAQAGYDAFHADTLEKQNSISSYFARGELLCTFNDHSRYQNYHIVHAVKKGADDLRRENFSGKEERQDEYGTSVISIQMLKAGGLIKITNRYNSTVTGCANTFDSNPDKIVPGLSSALQDHFKVDFTLYDSELPQNYIKCGQQIFKYSREQNGFYYGDQAWVKDSHIHVVDTSAGDALFDAHLVLFNNRSKTLRKIDADLEDNKADIFNRCYGGNPALRTVRDRSHQKLLLGDKTLMMQENCASKRAPCRPQSK